jgi:DNA-binding XRE family transcriptional regulator
MSHFCIISKVGVKKKQNMISIDFLRCEMMDHTELVVKNNLRKLRRAQGLSLWGLAVGVGTSTTTLSAIEKWGYRPGVDLCKRIASALGVNIADIWPEEPQG